MISDGAGFTDQDLQLTYIFDWKYPDVAAGSSEEEEKVQEQRKGAKTAIEMTLRSVREMVGRGEL